VFDKNVYSLGETDAYSVYHEFQMIRANTIRTIVRIICRIARMISCVARIIMSQSDYC